jgi:hypothetical protein
MLNGKILEKLPISPHSNFSSVSALNGNTGKQVGKSKEIHIVGES